MPYTAEVTRTNPTCVLFMIDQSRSMGEEIRAEDGTTPKSTGVADTINRWLRELSLKCTKAEGVSDYYHVGVIGYGNKVGPALVGQNAGRDLIPISEIAENPARIEKVKQKVPNENGRLSEQAVKVPIWFDPVADGDTPMCGASAEAHRILKDWLSQHGDSYSPLIIHITDGESTDGNPEQRVGALTNLSTSDGKTFLFNIHLSAHPDAKPVMFPNSPDDLPDDYSRMLFNTASPMTETMHAIAKKQGIPTAAGARAFVMNADMVALLQAVDIGTRPSNLAMEEPVVALGGGGGGDEAAKAGEAASEAARRIEEAEIAAATAEPAVRGKTTVKLSVMATGELVDAKIDTDNEGRIVGALPVRPLDPETEYRLGPSD